MSNYLNDLEESTNIVKSRKKLSMMTTGDIKNGSLPLDLD